ncbi:Uncharacterised protein [Mycobacteroides abscessus subsp. abscessus]|nr:Uncharacterised protein [Mycobacteroides abscessus subsp. abscessus]
MDENKVLLGTQTLGVVHDHNTKKHLNVNDWKLALILSMKKG